MRIPVRPAPGRPGSPGSNLFEEGAGEGVPSGSGDR